jgi:hypothetical protein
MGMMSRIDWSEDPGAWWEWFGRMWSDVGATSFADLSTGGQGSIDEYLESFISPDNPEIPSSLVAASMKHIFGRTDLGDYRNKIKNVHGHPIGVTVHVKTAFDKNILTIEDFSGECPMINIITTSGKKVTLNIGKLPILREGGIETTKVEF